MMGKVFEGRVRRLGNSMAVIIPREVLLEEGITEGDLVKLTIPIDSGKRKLVWKRIAGIDEGAAPFERDKTDRTDRL